MRIQKKRIDEFSKVKPYPEERTKYEVKKLPSSRKMKDRSLKMGGMTSQVLSHQCLVIENE